MSAQVMDASNLGRQFIVYYPLGETLFHGEVMSNHDIASYLLRQLKAGDSIAIPEIPELIAGWRVEEVGKVRKIYYSLRTYNIAEPEHEWESIRLWTLGAIRDELKQRLKATDTTKYNHRIVEVTEREIK